MKSYFVEIIFREYQTIFYFSFAYFLKRRFNFVEHFLFLP